MNKGNHIALFLFMFVLFCIDVTAFGVTPSRRTIDYDTEQHILTSRIVNNGGADFSVHIEAHGELAQYIYIDQPYIHIKASEAEKEFTYVLTLPEGLRPGPNIIDISITESQQADEGNHIGGMISLTQQLQVNVPYKGEYAEGFLSVYATDITSPVNALCEIISMGDENIKEISGRIEVYDMNNETIYSRTFDTFKDVIPKGSARWEDSFMLSQRGLYAVSCYAEYDGTRISSRKDLSVGSYNITILDAKVNNFRLGTIAKIDIDLVSDWNSPINDVYGEITIKDGKGTILRKSNLTKTLIPSLNKLTAYLDTADLLAGEYILGIKLYAGNQILSQEYRSIISENRIEIIMSERPQVQRKNIKNEIIAVILVLSAIILITLLAIRQNKKLYK